MKQFKSVQLVVDFEYLIEVDIYEVNELHLSNIYFWSIALNDEGLVQIDGAVLVRNNDKLQSTRPVCDWLLVCFILIAPRYIHFRRVWNRVPHIVSDRVHSIDCLLPAIVRIVRLWCIIQQSTTLKYTTTYTSTHTLLIHVCTICEHHANDRTHWFCIVQNSTTIYWFGRILTPLHTHIHTIYYKQQPCPFA